MLIALHPFDFAVFGFTTVKLGVLLFPDLSLTPGTTYLMLFNSFLTYFLFPCLAAICPPPDQRHLWVDRRLQLRLLLLHLHSRFQSEHQIFKNPSLFNMNIFSKCFLFFIPTAVHLASDHGVRAAVLNIFRNTDFIIFHMNLQDL